MTKTAFGSVTAVAAIVVRAHCMPACNHYDLNPALLDLSFDANKLWPVFVAYPLAISGPVQGAEECIVVIVPQFLPHAPRSCGEPGRIRYGACEGGCVRGYASTG